MYIVQKIHSFLAILTNDSKRRGAVGGGGGGSCDSPWVWES